MHNWEYGDLEKWFVDVQLPYDPMIYEQNKKQKLPNSISSVLGDKFNHGILFTYLKAIKYFDLIWSKINNRTNLNTH